MIGYQIYCQIWHLREHDKLSITQIAGALSIERSTVRNGLGARSMSGGAGAVRPRREQAGYL